MKSDTSLREAQTRSLHVSPLMCPPQLSLEQLRYASHSWSFLCVFLCEYTVYLLLFGVTSVLSISALLYEKQAWRRQSWDCRYESVTQQVSVLHEHSANEILQRYFVCYMCVAAERQPSLLISSNGVSSTSSGTLTPSALTGGRREEINRERWVHRDLVYKSVAGCSSLVMEDNVSGSLQSRTSYLMLENEDLPKAIYEDYKP